MDFVSVTKPLKKLNKYTKKYIFYNLLELRVRETKENYLRGAWWKKGLRTTHLNEC